MAKLIFFVSIATVPSLWIATLLVRSKLRDLWAEGYWKGRCDEIEGNPIDERGAVVLTAVEYDRCSSAIKARNMLRFPS